MTTTPNGWTASPRTADFGGLDNREVAGAPGVHLAPGVRAGAPADVLFHFAAQFHAHVEELKAGQCWGYAYRPDTNAHNLLSEHSAGVAIDLNAPEHPNGKRGTFTPTQVGILRALLAGYGGVIYWGGDFTGTDDEMHFELHGTLAQVQAVADKLLHPQPAPTPAPAPAPNGHGPGPHPGNEARHAPAELGPPAHSEPGYPAPGHDGVGAGVNFRAQFGDEGPHIGALQRGLNQLFPDYAELEVDDVYGGETAAVLAELARRAASDPLLSAADRNALKDADGYNVGPHLASALAHYGIHP